MGILKGQETMLFEGDCYNYLMDQFCMDIYFSISAITAYNGPMTAYSLRHILNSDMIDYLLPVLQKAPEGFLSYLVDNEYVELYDLGPADLFSLEGTVKTEKQEYIERKPMTPHIFSVYFKWKLKELFHKFDELLAANDVLTIHNVNLTDKY